MAPPKRLIRGCEFRSGSPVIRKRQRSQISMNVFTHKWEDLCRRFLPETDDTSIWRYSRLPSESDPAQGWKLHVSATLLTANTVLERLGPFLTNLQVLFK